MKLVESIVYDKLHDTCVRQCIKLNKVPADALRYGSLGNAFQVFQQVQEKVKNEGAEQNEAAPIQDGAASNSQDDAAPPEGEDVDMDPEKREAMARWKAHARELVRQNVELLVRPSNSSSEAMTDLLQESRTYKIKAPVNHFHLHIYDSKTEGESKTRPHVRMPVNRPQYMLASVQASLKARSMTQSEDDMYVTDDSIHLFLMPSNMTTSLSTRRHSRARSNAYPNRKESSMSATMRPHSFAARGHDATTWTWM